MLDFKQMKNVVNYGLIDFVRIYKGKYDKTIKCPVCGHRHLLEQDICPVCGFELDFVGDILFPDDPSPQNHDISLNEYRKTYKN